MLPGEKVVRALLQPEIREGVLTLLGRIYHRTISPTHMTILTDCELVTIREEQRPGKDRYGGVWTYIPLKKIVALSLAGLTNMAMVMMASGAFHAGHPEVAEIENAYHTLTPLLGSFAAAVFLISLLSSGIASSAVGTMAGQVVMQGFVGFRIPVWVRRVVTMTPAFVIVLMGIDSTRALVLSQVALSLALPVPMIARVLFTGRADIMGRFANRRMVDAAAIAGAAIVLALNCVLIAATVGVPIPGLSP